MVNKCAAPKCTSGYSSNNHKKIASFHFPTDQNLNQLWIRFVNRLDWIPTKHSVLCELHFEEKYIYRDKKYTLNWFMKPVPSKYSYELLQKKSSLPISKTSRNTPKNRLFEEDQLKAFHKIDTLTSLNDLNEAVAPPGFQFKRFEKGVVFYNIVFNEQTYFPTILESITVDADLNVQLQYKGTPLPLPSWFVKGHNAKLDKISMLENFPAYIRNTALTNHNTILDEIKNRELYKPQGRPPYSAEMIRYTLLLRYTSLQAYKLLLEKFPLPSISLLNKVQQGGVDSLKALKVLREKGKISCDCIMIVDEMYLQKAAQYQGGEYVGVDEEGNLYKGIVAFMITGLKESIPYVVQAIPEVTFSGKWLSQKMADNLENLIGAGFTVRGIVTDNHSTNVNAFSLLVTMFNSESKYFINHPNNHGKKTYLFYDSVHLVKNLRNNLLNGKKFVFPDFKYHSANMSIDCPSGYISWDDLCKIYYNDNKLKGKLRKAPKITYEVLHPGSNKQNVPLALAVIHETTIAASKSYYPNRKDSANFLTIFNTWWTIANSKQRFSPNTSGNAVVLGDNKMTFYKALANWIKQWSLSPAFTLTTQTASAFVFTLHAQAELVEELLNDGYAYVMTARLQSDPIERRFSQYRQMSGGRFLVSLREVLNSERILSCRSLIKESINFWEENLLPDSHPSLTILDELFDNRSDEIMDTSLDHNSEEVAITIAGYVAKKLSKRSKCENCKSYLKAGDHDLENNSYLSLLSRGGLFVPSKQLAEFVCSVFAILDFIENEISTLSIPVVKSSTCLVYKYAPKIKFVCENHEDWGIMFPTKIIVNVFFNNKQKLSKDLLSNEKLKTFKKRQRNK